MKFLYVDESGSHPETRYLVFFGTLIDAYKLKKVMHDVRPLLDAISDAYPTNLRELKSERMVQGRQRWGDVDADTRKALYRSLCHFIQVAGVHGYAMVVDKEAYVAKQCARQLPNWARTPWLTGAIALTAFVQRDHQNIKNNKGLTVLIFDDNKVELPKLSEQLVTPSPDMDEYYERPRRAEAFDQIIDTAFAIKSDHSRLVQLSDACAYALRRTAEIELGGSPEDWADEGDYFRQTIAQFSARMKFPTKTWVPNPHCDVGSFIKEVGVANLNHWVSGQ